MRGREVAGEVHEVDGSGSGHDVNGGSENQESGAGDDGDEVVLEVEPEAAKVVGVGLRSLDKNDGGERDQKEGQEMGHQVMVAQLHVLEIDALQEVGQSPGGVMTVNGGGGGGAGGMGTHVENE